MLQINKALYVVCIRVYPCYVRSTIIRLHRVEGGGEVEGMHYHSALDNLSLSSYLSLLGKYAQVQILQPLWLVSLAGRIAIDMLLVCVDFLNPVPNVASVEGLHWLKTRPTACRAAKNEDSR